MASEKHKTEIQRDLNEAQALGIADTPTFIVGRTQGDFVEGPRIVGAQPYAVFETRVKEVLGVK